MKMKYSDTNMQEIAIFKDKLSKFFPVGISSFGNNPNATGTFLEPLIKNVTRYVPQDKRSSTPIYLGATAGMRLERYQSIILWKHHANLLLQSF